MSLDTIKTQKPKVFLSSHRAGFLDLDLYGHVNTLRYLHFITDHRFAQMRERLGWDLATIQKLPVGFYVHRVELDFIRPLFGDESFEIRSWVSDLASQTCVVSVEMIKENAKLAAKAQMHLSNVDRATGRAIDWDPALISVFFESGEK